MEGPPPLTALLSWGEARGPRVSGLPPPVLVPVGGHQCQAAPRRGEAGQGPPEASERCLCVPGRGSPPPPPSHGRAPDPVSGQYPSLGGRLARARSPHGESAGRPGQGPSG